MGSFLSRLLDKLTGIKEARLLMLGLDNAGKTTILYKLKFDQVVTTVPTVGFNVESLLIKNVKFNVWDVGGQHKLRPLWRHYYTGTQALIFVIDSQDRARIEEARQEFQRITSDREMKDCLFLVFANKSDLDGSMKSEEVVKHLQLKSFKPEQCHIQETCAISGEGLMEGLLWLVNAIRNPPESIST